MVACFQNEGNVDQNESYLAEVRMLKFTINISLHKKQQHSHKHQQHGQFVSA